MGEMEKQLKKWADKHVKNPSFFVKMEVLSANDPRVVEHDDLIPVDGMIMLPIVKEEGDMSCQAFGFGLGDNLNGPNIDCDIHLAIKTLFAHIQKDCEDCTPALQLTRDLFNKINAGHPVIPLLIAIATDHFKMIGSTVLGAMPLPPGMVEEAKKECRREDPGQLNWSPSNN